MLIDRTGKVLLTIRKLKRCSATTLMYAMENDKLSYPILLKKLKEMNDCSVIKTERVSKFLFIELTDKGKEICSYIDKIIELLEKKEVK